MRLEIRQTELTMDHRKVITVLFDGKPIDSSRADCKTISNFFPNERSPAGKYACHILDVALAQAIRMCRFDELDARYKHSI